MRKIMAAIFLGLILFPLANLYAEVSICIIPFKGNDGNIRNVENKIREHLHKYGGLSIIADGMMKEIMEIQEKAQSTGSAYHDISKLKTAEYLVTGSLDSGRLNLIAIDVNKGAEIFSKEISLSPGDGNYLLKNISIEMRDAIIMDASTKTREVPEEVASYMQLLNNLVSTLHQDAKTSYNYIVFYYKGKHQFPKTDNPEMVSKGDLFLKVIRPNLLRSKLKYIFMKSAPPWIYIHVIADKLGKKTKHKFGIIELDDGSLGIGIYEPME
jgi:hypothetical protein